MGLTPSSGQSMNYSFSHVPVVSRERESGRLTLGFETLVFAASGIVSMHNQLVTLQRESII